jgi:UDPglucose 6-dehydrogenase
VRISIVGTGYVGLVSGVCFADKGHDVVCVDLDAERVAAINRAEPPIHEDGLPELLARNAGQRLSATLDLEKAVRESEVTMIAVGTPFDGDRIDLRYVEAAAAQIGDALAKKPGSHVVVMKSTVVPGTTDDVLLPILERASGRRAGEDFGVGMNPEFLKEGEAIQDFMHPDRVVLGAIDQRTRDVLEALYSVWHGVEIVRVNNKTAEMIKYTSNSLLATMISFSNEIGNLCAAIGEIDVVDVMRGLHLDERLMPILPDGGRLRPGFLVYLEAGCGFGGSCFPKDVKALIARGAEAGSPMRLLEEVIALNSVQPRQLIERLKRHHPELAELRVAVLGLAFKPGTDDLRESPALTVVRELRAAGARVRAYDPIARDAARSLFDDPEIEFPETLERAVHDADAILLVTRWPEFETLADLLAERDEAPLVVDGRRMLDKRRFPRYEGIGL